MTVGLLDVFNYGRRASFPNLALMKVSAWHKARGDHVEMWLPVCKYDRVYVFKVFGDEYSIMPDTPIMADEIICGGTGFAIEVKGNKEVYDKERDDVLPYEIEHIYPDYSLYPELTKNTAYGFLTRGCPNNCGFCIVSKKEGLRATKVADLSEFWRGQKYIKLLDANLLASRERLELLRQLSDSGAEVDFTQGLDARFVTEEIAKELCRIKIKRVHFAFDIMEKETEIRRGLEIFKRVSGIEDRKAVVYILTNFNTSVEDDIYRVREVARLGYMPDVRINRKPTAPQILRDLQRWCNSRFVYRSTDFADYAPRVDGRTMIETYKEYAESILTLHKGGDE